MVLQLFGSLVTDAIKTVRPETRWVTVRNMITVADLLLMTECFYY